MPKLKTKKGVAKRFKITATGKIKAKKSHLRHILTKKNKKRKRNLRKAIILSKRDNKMIKRQLPYSL